MTQIIKVTTTFDASLKQLLLRQTPGSKGRWGDNVFFINEDIRYCDWWFVCHSTALKQAETSICDPRHVVFVSMEPHEFRDKKFYQQFSKVIACDDQLKHPSILPVNVITWWAGVEVEFNNGHIFKPTINYDYDSLTTLESPKKKDRISIITSNNSEFPGHRLRIDFIEKLKKSELAKKIDIFGGGHNPIPDKIDALLPYKYHLALENSQIPNYWTEKIGDAFLGYAMPLYNGCPNIKSYFPPRSLVEIDISNFEQAVKIITNALENNLYEQNLSQINEARDLILNKYNFFQILSDIAKFHPPSAVVKSSIKPAHGFDSKSIQGKLAKARRLVKKFALHLPQY